MWRSLKKQSRLFCTPQTQRKLYMARKKTVGIDPYEAGRVEDRRTELLGKKDQNFGNSEIGSNISTIRTAFTLTGNLATDYPGEAPEKIFILGPAKNDLALAIKRHGKVVGEKITVQVDNLGVAVILKPEQGDDSLMALIPNKHRGDSWAQPFLAAA